VATEKEIRPFSLSDHQSTLFQIHPSLQPEIRDSTFK